MKPLLQAKRQSTGLTQAQVAEKAGITARGYQRYEADQNSKNHREPNITTAIRIADALDVIDLRELWGSNSEGALQ